MTVTWYTLLRYLHVLLAITAVGSNITYGVWKTLGAREPAHAPFALRGISFIDQRVANPAYGGLLVTDSCSWQRANGASAAGSSPP